jgi:hypothetical protein
MSETWLPSAIRRCCLRGPPSAHCDGASGFERTRVRDARVFYRKKRNRTHCRGLGSPFRRSARQGTMTSAAEHYAALKEYALSFDFEQGVQPLSSWQWPAVRSAQQLPLRERGLRRAALSLRPGHGGSLLHLPPGLPEGGGLERELGQRVEELCAGCGGRKLV